MWFISFLAFFFIALQAILCKCDILGMLAALCLLSSFIMLVAPEMRWWLRILVYWAGWYDMLYLGRISEYRYAAIEASAIIVLHFLALLPEGKLKHNPSASVAPSVATE